MWKFLFVFSKPVNGYLVAVFQLKYLNKIFSTSSATYFIFFFYSLPEMLTYFSMGTVWPQMSSSENIKG